jgi:hypothetical protein
MAWLWSEHDVTHHHRRRYRARELRKILTDAGFAVNYLSYYNFLLFPLIAGARILKRLSAPDRGDSNHRHDLAMPSAAINSLLERIFSSER